MRRGRGRTLDHADGVSEKAQLPVCGDARIELAQAARRGIARIDEFLLAIGALAQVHPVEVAPVHQHFAANLD